MHLDIMHLEMLQQIYTVDLDIIDSQMFLQISHLHFYCNTTHEWMIEELLPVTWIQLLEFLSLLGMSVATKSGRLCLD